MWVFKRVFNERLAHKVNTWEGDVPRGFVQINRKLEFAIEVSIPTTPFMFLTIRVHFIHICFLLPGKLICDDP